MPLRTCVTALVRLTLNDNVVKRIGSETGRCVKGAYKARRGLGDELSEWQPGEGEQQLQLYKLSYNYQIISRVNSSTINKMFAINIQPEYG